MPSISFETSAILDAGVTYQITGRCEVAGSTAEWTVTESPVGGTVIFSAPDNEVTDFTVSIDGQYEFTLCCRYTL